MPGRSGGRVSSGGVRGLATLEPFSLPPCGMPSDLRYGPKRGGRSARELRDEGCTPQELRELWGFSATELAMAGLTALELREGGVPTREIALCGRFNAAECRAAGCSVHDLMGSPKFSTQQLVAAGFTAADFGRAGLSAGAIRGLGFSEAQVLESGYSGQPIYMRPPGGDGGGPALRQPPTQRPSTAAGRLQRPRSARRPQSAAPLGSRSTAAPA